MERNRRALVAALALIGTAAIQTRAQAQTEQQLLKNLHATEQRFGSDDTRTAEFMFAVADFYHQHNQLDKEHQYYQRAMHIFEQKPGKRSDMLRYYSDRMARVDADENKCEDAERLYKRAVTLGDQLPGKENTYVVPNTLAGLAQLYEHEQRWPDAESALKRRLQLRHRFLNAGETDIALVDLANLYVKEGKYSEAQPLFDQLLKISPLPDEVRTSYSQYLEKAKPAPKAQV